MRVTKLCNKTGFTLVELSIVLVIIGLLIGGILVARSMIETAKLQNMIRNLQQYNVAINNFRTNYKFIPGDDAFFDPPGNQNELLDTPSTCNTTNALASGNEISELWTHLTQSGMLKGTYSFWSPAACGGTDQMYMLNIAGTSTPIFTTTSLFKSSVGVNTDKVSIFYYTGGISGNYFRTYVPANYALALDAKLDDGINNSGKLTSLYVPGPGYCTDGIATNGGSTNILCRFDYYPD